MTTTTAERIVSTEEFLGLAESAPDDVTLELIQGQVQERPMTTRSPKHSMALARISQMLLNWLDEQPDRLGVVGTGETRCRIARNPDTIVGIDVAYFEGVDFVELPDGAKFFDGPPVIAVEVLSPSDEHEEVVERVRGFLAAGVPQVWVADPEFRSITVHRPGTEESLFTASRELTAEPELPGFRCRVESLFVGRQKVGRNDPVPAPES